MKGGTSQIIQWMCSIKKLLCNCCEIRESDWYMLLDSAKIKHIDNQIHDFYNNCKIAFSTEHSQYATMKKESQVL